MPEPERITLLAETLAAARHTKAHSDRWRALITLAPHLPTIERTAALREALAAAESDGNAVGLSNAVCEMAPHADSDLAEEMLAIGRTISFPGARAVALAAVAPRLSQPQRNSVLADALAIARADARARGYRSAETLAKISEYLPEPERTGVLAEALTACEAYYDELSKVIALADFAADLDGSLAERALRVLFAIAHGVQREYLLRALREFIPAISRLGGADAVESLRRSVTDIADWYP